MYRCVSNVTYKARAIGHLCFRQDLVPIPKPLQVDSTCLGRELFPKLLSTANYAGTVAASKAKDARRSIQYCSHCSCDCNLRAFYPSDSPCLYVWTAFAKAENLQRICSESQSMQRYAGRRGEMPKAHAAAVDSQALLEPLPTSLARSVVRASALPNTIVEVDHFRSFVLVFVCLI
jgi:hypothetical protein